MISWVRLGGVLSPALFNIYVDTIISKLRKAGFGYHVHGFYIGCMMYVDDLSLMWASVFLSVDNAWYMRIGRA